MTVSKGCEADILRYYYVEKWRIGTIARQLGIHHSVVTRVLSQAGTIKPHDIAKKSMIEPFLPWLIEKLTQFPRLTASRLYQMACARNYPGGPDHFRYLVSLHRPRPVAEAYLRLRTLPGEQAQVDWGHFGHLQIGKARRALMAFVMVLSYSRKIFLRFYLNQRLESFLDGHQAAFEAFQGVPKVLLYDNLRSVVLERQGEAIRFHTPLLQFAAHYRYEPRPVAIARGNEKGRVERAIRYVRDNFFAARTWNDLNDLNAQALAWCEGPAANRRCPEQNHLSVMQVFKEEQSALYPLPDNPFPIEACEEVRVGKTPYVRFDLNDYSLPPTFVRRSVTVRASPDKILIVADMKIIAEHPRSYDKDQQIEQACHIQELVEIKKRARHHRGQDRLTQALSSGNRFLMQAALHGYPLGTTTSQLLQLLDEYGAAELEEAIKEALCRGVPHANAVRLSLVRRREQRQLPPPINLDLPNEPRIRSLVVRPHSLNSYDQLQTMMESEENEQQ